MMFIPEQDPEHPNHPSTGVYPGPTVGRYITHGHMGRSLPHIHVVARIGAPNIVTVYYETVDRLLRDRESFRHITTLECRTPSRGFKLPDTYRTFHSERPSL